MNYLCKISSELFWFRSVGKLLFECNFRALDRQFGPIFIGAQIEKTFSDNHRRKMVSKKQNRNLSIGVA